MNFQEFRRDLASVRLLLDYGAEQGLAAQELLRGSRIATELLEHPDAEILAAQELRVVENLLRLLGDPPGLGLELGLRYRIATFGMWGYGLMCSATVGAAVDMALRFLPLSLAFCDIDLQLRGDEAVMRFAEPDLPAPLRRHLVQRDMAGAASLMRQMTGGSLRLTRFELKEAAAGGGALRVGSIAGARVSCQGRMDAIAFASSQLADALPQAEPGTMAMCERMCDALMLRRRAIVGVAEALRHHLRAQPPGAQPRLSDFAELLHVGERTLKRRLQREGASFRALVNEVRAGTAAELVEDPARTITAIAERLGYADLSSFSQAFKRWHGLAPEQHRRLHAASAAGADRTAPDQASPTEASRRR